MRLSRLLAAPLGLLVAGWMIAGPAGWAEAKPGWGRGKQKVEQTKPEPIKPERVSEVAGARWSGMVGFVSSGPAPESEGAAAAGNLFVPSVSVSGD